jgi:hypothetical protein
VLVGDLRRLPFVGGLDADLLEASLEELGVEKFLDDRSGAGRSAPVLLAADHGAKVVFDPVDHGPGAAPSA